jgi:putative spermidine/putrescine transport system permease protein
MSQAITLLNQPAATPARRPHRLVFVLSLLPLALLVLPLIAIVPMSFTATDIIALPPDRWGLDAYCHLWAAPGWGQALLSSLEVAAAAAVLAVIAGAAAAIGIGRLHGAIGNCVTALVLAPLALPVVVMGLAQFEFFARLRLNGTLQGIALAHGVLGVPFVFLTMRAALARLDVALVRAAQSLGAGAWSLVRWVYLPVLLPAVLAGAVLAYGASLEEVVIALFLSGPRAITLPVKLFTELQYNLSPIILAVATLLMGVVLVFGLIVAVAAGTKGRAYAARIR